MFNMMILYDHDNDEFILNSPCLPLKHAQDTCNRKQMNTDMRQTKRKSLLDCVNELSKYISIS